MEVFQPADHPGIQSISGLDPNASKLPLPLQDVNTAEAVGSLRFQIHLELGPEPPAEGAMGGCHGVRRKPSQTTVMNNNHCAGL